MALNEGLADENQKLTSLLSSRSDDYKRTLENCRKRIKTSEPSSTGERGSIDELQAKVRQLEGALNHAKQEAVRWENELETARETNGQEISRLREKYQKSMKTNLAKEKERVLEQANTLLLSIEKGHHAEISALKEELTKLRNGRNTRSTKVHATNDRANAPDKLSYQEKLSDQDRKLCSLRHELVMYKDLLELSSVRAPLESALEVESKCILMFAKALYHSCDSSWPDYEKRIKSTLRNVKVQIKKLRVMGDGCLTELLAEIYNSSQVDIWVRVIDSLRNKKAYSGNLIEDLPQILENVTPNRGGEDVTGSLHPDVIEAFESYRTTSTRGAVEPAISW